MPAKKMDIQRTLDFRDSPVRTPRQNLVYASWPAACAANWARNVAAAPSTPGFRVRPYWQIRRPYCSRRYPREPDIGGRRSLPAPCGSLAHTPHCTRRSTPHRPRPGRTYGQSAAPAPCHAPAYAVRVNLFPDNSCQILPNHGRRDFLSPRRPRPVGKRRRLRLYRLDKCVDLRRHLAEIVELTEIDAGAAD